MQCYRGAVLVDVRVEYHSDQAWCVRNDTLSCVALWETCTAIQSRINHIMGRSKRRVGDRDASVVVAVRPGTPGCARCPADSCLYLAPFLHPEPRYLPKYHLEFRNAIRKKQQSRSPHLKARTRKPDRPPAGKLATHSNSSHLLPADRRNASQIAPHSTTYTYTALRRRRSSR